MHIRTLLFLSTAIIPFIKYSDYCQNQETRSGLRHFVCDTALKAYDFVSTFSFVYSQFKIQLEALQFSANQAGIIAFYASKILVSELDLAKEVALKPLFTNHTKSYSLGEVIKSPIKEAVILSCRFATTDSLTNMFLCNFAGDFSQYGFSDWHDPLTYSGVKLTRSFIKTVMREGEERMIPLIGDLNSYYSMAMLRNVIDDFIGPYEQMIKLSGNSTDAEL